MSGAASLQAFRDAPARYADPALVAALIAPGLRPETAQTLLQSPRTAGRAEGLLLALLPPAGAENLNADDAALILAGAAALDRVGLAAGAVWQGKRVRALVRGADIAALEMACGPAARACALRYAPPAAAEGSGDLIDDIRRDAVACIASWCAALPDWAAARMRLVRRQTAAPDHAAARAELLRSLAREVLA